MNEVHRTSELEAVVADLTTLVRDLQELLDGYGPMWYSEELADRISKTLANADSALR